VAHRSALARTTGRLLPQDRRERADVPYRQKPGYFTGHGAYRSWIEGAYSFDVAKARRAAPGILSGMVEVDPAWRTDTRKGRLLYLGFLVQYFFIRLFAIVLIVAPIAFVVLLVVTVARGG
jgi:hypothetical protein